MKLIYKSSYDRGLEHLLKMWPDIKKELPEATLEVAYGWELFDRGYSGNPYMMEWKNKINELMKQEGITHHGRISKKELDDLTSKCQIWAYPTHFGETNCISALDSQKLGCVPVTMSLAALEDTVFSGVKLEGDITDPEVQKEYVKELVSLAKDSKRLEEEKIKAIEGAKKYDWVNIASEWIKHFK